MISFKKEPVKYDKPVKLTIQFVGKENTMHFVYNEIITINEKGIMYVHNSTLHRIYAINFNNAAWWSVNDEEMEENNNESVTDC